MSFNPFNQSVSTLDETADSIHDEVASACDPAPANQSGMFVYDLETVPDESAFPRPEKKEITPRELDFGAVLKTAETVKTEIASGITQEQAESLLQAEQSGKSRKTVLSLLRSAVEESDRELAEWKKLATDPFRCRIVAIGLQWYDAQSPDSFVCQTVEQERGALQMFWDYAACGIRCGYNITGFDDGVIVARSMLLNVLPHGRLSLKRYGNKSVDLMRVLFDGASAMKLKDLVNRLGITPPAGDVNGSHVLDMVDGAQWDQLEAYVRSDVVVEMALLKRLQTVVEF